MKLLYTLTPTQIEALKLEQGEKLWYCVPVDLWFDNKSKQAKEAYTTQIWLAVTQKRFLVLDDTQVTAAFILEECEKIRCEHQVHSGIVTVFMKDGREICAARFSMRHIVRVSYVTRGAQALITALEEGIEPGESERVTSLEYEKYCDKCGRALPGTSKCPYCEGKADILRKFFLLCGEYVGRLLLISLLMILVAGVNLLSPMIQRNFIDNTLSSGKGTWVDLGLFVGITFSLLVGRILLEVARFWHCSKLGASLSMTLRQKLYYKIQTLSLSFINDRKPGELMNRVARDTRQIRNFMEEVFGDMFSTLLTMIVSLVVMFLISWKMTLLSMVFIVLVFVISKAFWHHIRVIFHKQWVKSDELSSSLQDIISGIRVVKSFGKEERESKRFMTKADEFAAISRKNETFWAVFFPILTFLMGCGTYIAVYFGGMDVLDGRMTMGELVQYITYCGYLFGPLGWMTHLPRAVMQMITSLNRIYDVLDEEPRLADKEDSKEFDIQGAFTFERISFGYQK